MKWCSLKRVTHIDTCVLLKMMCKYCLLPHSRNRITELPPLRTASEIQDRQHMKQTKSCWLYHWFFAALVDKLLGAFHQQKCPLYHHPVLSMLSSNVLNINVDKYATYWVIAVIFNHKRTVFAWPVDTLISRFPRCTWCFRVSWTLWSAWSAWSTWFNTTLSKASLTATLNHFTT